MPTYTKITDFAAKDALLTGNPSKIIKGTEIGAEFDSIAAADADNLKASSATGTGAPVLATNPTLSGITDSGNLTFTGTGSLIQSPSNPMTFTVGGSERVRIDTSGKVGIGTASSNSDLQVYNSTAQVLLTATGDGQQSNVRSQTYLTSSVGPAFSLNKYRGSQASPTAIASGDNLGELRFVGYGGTNSRILSVVSGNVDTYVSDTNISTYLSFLTSPAGSVTATERMRIDSSGNILNVSTGGLGYGTGSGGSVTQLTSKSTLVTLDNTNGQITMNNAALAANTTVSFQLNNIKIVATDVLNVSLVAGVGTISAYGIGTACGAGYAVIKVRNESAGSLSEAIQLNFAVIKAVIT